MNFRFDLQYAWRLMRKSWGYSLMCASVVALSVGLAVWVHALIRSQAFEELAFPDSQTWYSVQIAADTGARARPGMDAYTWQRIAERMDPDEVLGAFADRAVVLSEGQATTSLRGTVVSPRLLSEMHVAPLMGRVLAESDAHAEAAPVAVISFDAWQRYFSQDPAIVGKTARIDAAPVQIVGVMPRDFLVIDDYEIWLPLRVPRLVRPGDSTLTVFPFVRLRDEQRLSTGRNTASTAVREVNAGHPRLFKAGRNAVLIPGALMYSHGVTPILTTLGLIALGVLLIGCVNISMVFLARLLERSRELALRSALGASRGRIMRQCLLETALVVLLGLVAGFGLAWAGIEWTHGISEFGSRILASGRSTNLPQLRAVDALAAVVFAALIWLLSTLIPAWRISRQDASVVLGGSGKGATTRGGNRSIGVLVGLQVLVSCLVLVACGNVVLALRRETNKPTGLDTARVLISTFPTAFDKRYDDASRRLRYWENLGTAITDKVPGVDIAFTSATPRRPARVPAVIEGREGADQEGAFTLPVTAVSDRYFPVLGIQLRTGRLFDTTDGSESLKVAIVDENMAARYWPGQNVLGKRVQLNPTEAGEWVTIVGVVSAVRGTPYRLDADIGTLYRPLRQVAPPAFHVLVRQADASDRRVAVRAAAFSVDRDLPLHNLQAFDDYVAALSLSYPAMIKLFLAISLITAILAASGLFGLISRSVAQRTQEVGIRRALGATAWRATSMFRRQGALYLSVAAVGLALGIVVMPLLSRAIPNILERAVPVTLGVILLMASVIVTASWLPTRRAVALDPSDALRYD
jgi:putative ABC transport system permease protein